MTASIACRLVSTVDNAVDEFRKAMHSAGLNPNKIEPNGEIERCGTDTHPNSKNGFYVMFADPFAGGYGDYASGMYKTWSMAGTSLSAADKERLRAEIDRQRQKREGRRREKT